MTPPRGFQRELQCIDPDYSVFWNEQHHVWDILFYNKEQRTVRVVARFEHISHKELTELRYRKWLGRKLRTAEGPDRLMKQMKNEKKQEKEKEIEQVTDVASHELKDIYDTGGRHTVT